MAVGVDTKAAITGYLQSLGGELRDPEGRTAAVIGEALGLSAHEVGQELKGLENLGRVTRDWHPGRRKVFGVRLVSANGSRSKTSPARAPAQEPSAPAQPDPEPKERAPKSRDVVLDFLRVHGPFEDLDGQATAKLKEAIGYEGQTSGLRQLLANLQYTGQIERTMVGKRTYRIALPDQLGPIEPIPAIPVPPAGTTDVVVDLTEGGDDPLTGEVDYDGMARSLLRRAAEALAARDGDSSDVRQQLDRALSRHSELSKAVARVGAERDAVVAERDALRRQLEDANRNTELLTEKLNSRPARSRVRDSLGEDEKALLDRMGRSWRNGSAQKS